MKILVTPTSLSRGPEVSALVRLRQFADDVVLNPHGRPLTSAELREVLPGVDGVIAGVDAYDAEALASADVLRVISCYGAGADRVDIEAARARGIVVTRTPGGERDRGRRADDRPGVLGGPRHSAAGLRGARRGVAAHGGA